MQCKFANRRTDDYYVNEVKNMNTFTPDILKQYNYFAGLSSRALDAICSRLQLIEFSPGTRIIREGERADSFYIIKEGEVEVTKTTKWGQKAKIINLKCGEGFGEMALLTCSPRNSSVMTKTDVILYRLLQTDFEEVVLLDSEFTNKLVMRNREYCRYNSIKTLQPFALLDPGEMHTLSGKLDERKYSDGENIISQGESADAYYVIMSGSAEVTRKMNSGVIEQVTVLRDGEGFGEEALIREEGRSATVQAIGDTTVLRIDKADFDDVMKKSFLEWDYPEDILDKRNNYVIIDARIEPEYQDEHIAGAINIPIEVLRQKYGELDSSREYYTYCTNDSRGMTAAFLLRSQGYKAKTIRGGLGAWDGPVVHGGDGIHLV